MDQTLKADWYPINPTRKTNMVSVEQWVLEAVLVLHSIDMPMTGDIVEPIRRAISGQAVSNGARGTEGE